MLGEFFRWEFCSWNSKGFEFGIRMGIPRVGVESRLSNTISTSAFLTDVFRVVISVVFISKIFVKSDCEAGQAMPDLLGYTRL